MPDAPDGQPGVSGIFKSILSTEGASGIRKKYRNLMLSAMAVEGAYRTIRATYFKYRDKLAYVISVSGTDPLYDDLQAWLLELMPKHKRRSLVASSPGGGGSKVFSSPFDDDGPRSKPAPITLSYRGDREQVVMLDGQRVRVFIERQESYSRSNRGEGEQSMWWDRKYERIVFTALTPEGRDAVLALLGRIHESKNTVDRNPEFHMANTYGDFRRRSDIPRRSLESVVLPQGQMEGLVKDMEQFFSQEDRYTSLGQPYHRGYLLHGPPGTGKTSIPKALASHFGMDIYYIPLSDLSKDAGLLNLVSAVRPGALLLLEDIDVFHAATSRDENMYGGVTLSGLLNALDGMSTPHGLVTFMTTNKIEALDEALIRPGRVDVMEHIGYITTDQCRTLYENFYGRDAGCILPVRSDIAPAKIVELLKVNMDDPMEGAMAINALIQSPASKE